MSQDRSDYRINLNFSALKNQDVYNILKNDSANKGKGYIINYICQLVRQDKGLNIPPYIQDIKNDLLFIKNKLNNGSINIKQEPCNDNNRDKLIIDESVIDMILVEDDDSD